MRFSIYQDSNKGGRRVNQDRMGYLYTRDSLLLMIADGMGGHARGEVAAELSLQTVAALYQAQAKPTLSDPTRFLHDAVMASHHELHRYRAEHQLPEAPRTTLVLCVVQRGVATWVHIGDSRLYLLRQNGVAHQTVDHSRVNYLISAGLLRPEDAKDHPERNRIFNCVGAYVAPTIEVEVPVILQPGDTLLLCTDGFWGNLNQSDIIDTFGHGTVMRAVPQLIELALQKGGPDADNCTALAMSWAGFESLDMIPDDDHPVSTLDIPSAVMASTVQMPLTGAEPGPVFTDDDIDNAVSEIQQAIQRAAKLVPNQSS
jgi:protein phosphatase